MAARDARAILKFLKLPGTSFNSVLYRDGVPASTLRQIHQSTMTEVAVIGAGVVGLSSACAVQKLLPNSKVTIIADKLGAELVSHGAGGVFRPQMEVLLNEHNGPLIRQCLRDTWNHLAGLAMSSLAKDSGQMMVAGLLSHRKPMDESYSMLKECSLDFHRLSETDMRKRGIPEEFKYTYTCTNIISQPDVYLPWLTKQFQQKGGVLQKKTVNKLEELYGEFQAVINCCGLRAKTFLGDDECYPVRGQLVMIKAPWVKQFHYFDTDVYIYPHMDKTVIGGTREKGDDNLEIDRKIREKILRDAETLYPEIKGAEQLYDWVGLRPGRSSPRLEVETLDLDGNRKLPVIHNYGHGGNGISLSWGTGIHAAKLAKEALQSRPKASL